MGRPALNLEETKVRLNAGQKDRIIAIVGEQRMSAFIREAVEEKLAGLDPAAVRSRPRPPKDPG